MRLIIDIHANGRFMIETPGNGTNERIGFEDYGPQQTSIVLHIDETTVINHDRV